MGTPGYGIRRGISRRALLKCCAGSAVLGLGAGLALPKPARAAHPDVPAAAPPVLRSSPPASSGTETWPTQSAPAVTSGMHPNVEVRKAKAKAKADAPSTTASPDWAKRWPRAIHSLDEYSARCPRPVYPSRAIMLTVDDGPSSLWTPRYLELFAEHDVVATFCMIGRNIAGRERIVRSVAENGHTIANHTWTHDLALTTRSTARIRRELRETSAAIEDACGVAVRQFRAPGGNWGRAILDELAELRMMPLGWNVDPRDWSLPGTHWIERTFMSARRHDIVLCHDGGGDRSETFAALTYALPRWKRAGYVFVTLPTPR